MKIPFLLSLTASLCLAGVSFAKPAADILRAEPFTVSACYAKLVIIGEVLRVEKEVTELDTPDKPSPDATKLQYKVATVKVLGLLQGGKGLSEVKVGVYVGGGERFSPRILNPLNLKPLEVGDEGCFILEPHIKGDFYVFSGQPSGGLLGLKNPDYHKEINAIKKLLRTQKDPFAATALKSTEKEDRMYALTSATIKFRDSRLPGAKQEVELTKEESNLLLDVLLEAPMRPELHGTRGKRDLFYMLIGVEQINKLGFTIKPAKPGEDIEKIQADAINEFIKTNREKLVLKQIVPKQ